MKTYSKRFEAEKKKLEADSMYNVENAMRLVKEVASAKFNESIEAHISL